MGYCYNRSHYISHNKKLAVEKLASDNRLKDAKIFKLFDTPIAVTEDGNIGIANPATREITVINMRNVNSYDIAVDRQTRLSMKGINIVFETIDFNNPIIKVPLGHR